ncbi:MAG: hypothetical protein WA324_00255 [Bryobacteraceae bacterium]
MQQARRFLRHVLTLLVVNRVSHWIASIVIGVSDVVFHCVYQLFRLEHHPNFFRSWQASQCSFYPPFEIPLNDGRQYLKHSRSASDPFGVYTAAIVFRYIPRADAEKGLVALQEISPHARLDSSVEDAHGNYPVCYCFGFHQNLLSGWMLKLNRQSLGIRFKGIDYSEVCIGLLGVELNNPAHVYPGPFLFMPHLHLNRFYPTFLGRLTGLAKIWNRVNPSDENYHVHDRSTGNKLYRAEFEPYGEIAAPERFTNLAPFLKLLELPLVTCLLGDILYTYFDWGWEHSFVQPVRGRLECFSDDVPCMPRGCFEFGGIDQDVSGAFRVHVPWELVAPFRRNAIVKQFLDARTAERQTKRAHAPLSQAVTAGGTPHK